MKDIANQRKLRLYAYLKESILTIKMRPGSDLEESKLSEEFEVSRTPLREVFRQLAGEGYIELRENRGARVSEMSYTMLRDFFLSAPMIYGAILRLAAKNAKPEQIEELLRVQESFKNALRNGSSADRAMANNRFHEITGEMAGNTYLLPSFNRLLIDHARIGMTFYRPQNTEMAGNLSEASRHHDEIIEAIRIGDEAAAAKLADDHWNLSRDQIELFVMPGGLDMTIDTNPWKTTA